MVGPGIIIVFSRKDLHKTEEKLRANVRKVSGEKSQLSPRAMARGSALCPVDNKKSSEIYESFAS